MSTLHLARVNTSENRKRVAWLIAAAALVTALSFVSTSASFMYHAAPVRVPAANAVYAVHVLYWASWTAIAWLALRAARLAALGSWLSSLAIFGALFAGSAVVLGVNLAISDRLAVTGEDLSRNQVFWYASSNVSLFALVCLGAVLAQDFRMRGRRAQERREALLENQRLAAALAEARLAVLRAQIHPHLIFNALNCVAALVAQGRQDEANAAISRLGELLRMTLAAMDAQRISLRDEFALVEAMLEIGALRFAGRVTWKLELPKSLEDVEITPFLVQPLAENALLHAVGRTSAPVLITVQASMGETGLRLVVEDAGVETPAPPIVAGFGLRNLRERVELQGGRLSVQPNQAGGVRACIELSNSDEMA